jgi:prepilin-type N-terminal cleavage/methylation domain-containing protein
MTPPHMKKPAFTLVELLIVISIIVVLAAATLVAIDPARRLHESRNAVRSSDIATILEAVKKYQVDFGGVLPTDVAALSDGEFAIIGTDDGDLECSAGTFYTTGVLACTGGGAGGAGDCVNLSAMGSNYISAIPFDTVTGSLENSDYYIGKDANGAITVGACGEEGEAAGGGISEIPVLEVVR